MKTVATFYNLEDLEASVFSNDREKLIICNFFRSNHTCFQEGYTENTHKMNLTNFDGQTFILILLSSKSIFTFMNRWFVVCLGFV